LIVSIISLINNVFFFFSSLSQKENRHIQYNHQKLTSSRWRLLFFISERE